VSWFVKLFYRVLNQMNEYRNTFFQILQIRKNLYHLLLKLQLLLLYQFFETTHYGVLFL